MNEPEKIYVSQHSGLHFYKKQNDDDIEYTRTDVFIKKAKEAFCKAACSGYPPRCTCTSLGTCREYDNFVNYIKEE